jgi:hypothetical protein
MTMTKEQDDCYLQSNAFRRGYAADRSGSDAVNPFRFDSVEYHDFIAGALVREKGWPERNMVPDGRARRR